MWGDSPIYTNSYKKQTIKPTVTFYKIFTPRTLNQPSQHPPHEDLRKLELCRDPSGDTAKEC